MVWDDSHVELKHITRPEKYDVFGAVNASRPIRAVIPGRQERPEPFCLSTAAS